MAPSPVSIPQGSSTESHSISKEDSNIVVKSPYPDIVVPKDVEVHELIFEQIRQYETLTALTCGLSGKKLAFVQILEQAKAFGATLIKARYRKGDIAAVCLGNVLEFPVAVLGCWSAGLAVACLNPRYTEQETLRQFRLIDAKLIITERETLATVEQAKRENPGVRHIILVGDAGAAETESYLQFSDMVETNTKGVIFSTGKTHPSTETTAWLGLSSGTTGPPKWVMLSHAQMVANMLQFVENDVGPTKSYFQTGLQERTVALMPFFHAYGFWYVIMLGLYQGTHAVCLPRFQSQTFLKVIRQHKPTCLHLVTPLIAHIVNSDDFPSGVLESVHTVVGGGAPIGPGLISRLIEKANRYIFFMELYGMTEVLVTHSLNPSSNNTKIGSCGRCFPSNSARVLDLITGVDLGAHQNGEIVLKPPVPVKGYYKNTTASKDLIDEEGWVHTGDVGHYDEDGYFYIVDRIKELIKVKGFQVAPSELEDLLRKQEKVEDCAVIGVPSEEYGEVPRAYVVTRKGETLTETEIHDYMIPLVATYKQFKGGVEFVNEIEKSPSGKILRRELRDKYKHTYD